MSDNAALSRLNYLMQEILVKAYNRNIKLDQGRSEVLKAVEEYIEGQKDNSFSENVRLHECLRAKEKVLGLREQGLRERAEKLNERDASQTQLYAEIQRTLIEQQAQTMLMQDILSQLRLERELKA